MSFHPRYRISEKSFIISASILLSLATLAVLIRCLIRFFLQRKRFALDDGLVLASFAFLLSTFVIAYIKVIPAMYFDYNTISATEDNEEENLWLSLQAQAQETGYQLHLWVAIANTASCAGILAAKLSFLFFFRTLIDRTWTRVWQVYWWVVTIFTGASFAWIVAVQFVSCPYFFDSRQIECTTARRRRVIIIMAIVSFTVEILSDLLILLIPVSIIRKVRIRRSQKILLSFTLCLTVVFLALNIVRLTGLVYDGAIDTVWSVYWQVIVTEVGVFLAAAASFRSFFVARSRKKHPTPAFSVKVALKYHLTGRSWFRSSDDNNSLSLGQWDDNSVRELQGAQPSTNDTMTRTESQDSDAWFEHGSRCEDADASSQDVEDSVLGVPPSQSVGIS